MFSLMQARLSSKWRRRWGLALTTGAILFFGILAQVARGGETSLSSPMIGDDLDRESLRVAIARSMTYLAKLPPRRIVGREPREFTAAEVMATLQAFEELLEIWPCRDCWIKALKRRFAFIPSSRNAATRSVLFTGYYQPVMEGSLTRTTEYPHPIYRKPDDLIVADAETVASSSETRGGVGRLEGGRFVPYYTRAQIDLQGALRGRGYEIAWVKDPVDIFFMQIQGSGVLQLPDGKRVQIGYAAQNGRPYRSIGRLLIDEGEIPREEMSMQRLRRYLAEHPAVRNEIMMYNESYVFFRFLSEGPLGSLEVPVTMGRSVATDLRLFPNGGLALIYSERPVLDGMGNLVGWTPFLRFVLNQDTGGAIRGPQRVDLYFGTGERAGAEAGYMNSPGKLYFLALKKPPKTASR